MNIRKLGCGFTVLAHTKRGIEVSLIMANFSVILPGKSNASGLHIVVSEDPRGDDLPVLCQELLQLGLIHVGWEVGNVQVSGVLLLLLGHLCLNVRGLQTFHCLVCSSWQLKVHKPVACQDNPV